MLRWRLLPKPVFPRVTETTIIDLLRHGEVAGGQCYRGQQDDPLTAKGRQQLHTVTKPYSGWQSVISSPLQRCASFATELAQDREIPLKTEAAFSEIAFGEWEGKTAEELLKTDGEKIKSYWDNPVAVTPPGGERLLDFQQRVLCGWQDLIAQYRGRHIVVVTHAGVIRMILSHVLDMPITALFRLQVELASLSRIQVEPSDNEIWSRLVFHGVTDHA